MTSTTSSRPTSVRATLPEFADRGGRGFGRAFGRPLPRWAVVVGIVLALAGIVVVRLLATSPLWLDEAQSVAIARLPLHGGLFTALRHDGSPPIYYLLLHGWIAAFGQSTDTVRALSVVISLVQLPLAYAVGRAFGAPRFTRWAGLLVLGSLPWSAYYGTETRMYSLVVAEVLLLALALAATWRRPRALPVLGVAVSAALLLLTHYWSVYLLAAVGLVAIWYAARRPPVRREAVATIIGLVLAAPLIAAWVPTWLYQMKHTGTPWASPPAWGRPLTMFSEWADGSSPWGAVLLVALWISVLLAVVTVTWRAGSVTLDLRRTTVGRRVAVVLALAMAFAVLGARVGHVAYAIRYTAIVVPLGVALVALGVHAVPRQLGVPLLAVMVACGVVASVGQVRSQRTQAHEVALALRNYAHPGDIVVYCPDQLGPAVRRFSTPPRRQIAFPTGQDPVLINWVDYQTRQENATPREFANRVVQLAGDKPIWLVSAPGYSTYADMCESLALDITAARGVPTDVVSPDARSFERDSLQWWGSR